MPASPKPIRATEGVSAMPARLASALRTPQIRMAMALFDIPKSVRRGAGAEQVEEGVLGRRRPPVGAHREPDRAASLLDRIADRHELGIAGDLVRREQG